MSMYQYYGYTMFAFFLVCQWYGWSTYLGLCWWHCCWSTLLMVDLEVKLVSDSRDFEFELEFETRSRSEERIGDTEHPPTMQSCWGKRVLLAKFYCVGEGKRASLSLNSVPSWRGLFTVYNVWMFSQLLSKM